MKNISDNIESKIRHSKHNGFLNHVCIDIFNNIRINTARSITDNIDESVQFNIYNSIKTSTAK